MRTYIAPTFDQISPYAIEWNIPFQDGIGHDRFMPSIMVFKVLDAKVDRPLARPTANKDYAYTVITLSFKKETCRFLNSA